MKQADPPRTLLVAEPRGMWLLRQPIVADCSVVAALVFAEDNDEQAGALLRERALHAPTLLPYELANVASKKLRAGASLQETETALADFDEQRIELHPVPAAGALDLARRYTLSAYDAAYLWLAAELKAPLATFDRKLGEAARRHLGTLE